MKFSGSAAILALLLSPAALAAPSLSPWKDQSPIQINEDLSVPGDNPLNFCTPPKNDILTIERVDLFPNPPLPGKTLTIKATGTFSKQVDKGAKVLLQVKYGVIRLINQTADLCEQIENVDLHCPLEKGKMEFTKNVDLPRDIPPTAKRLPASKLVSPLNSNYEPRSAAAVPHSFFACRSLHVDNAVVFDILVRFRKIFFGFMMVNSEYALPVCLRRPVPSRSLL
ncbi:phosphatidylglycerol/phosphatidylinositol transfer protein [Uncinocarpus reesii 1704]|uniref:Phosphatidylglycerol/phosphatidylinositol transfer protein n=1 Tax=Uncinocarpus reesii (strain UAMH 1704) TaxID=336963 RepID=C4JG50_UNCRE|nr:phosphatidylglycerol/phosphatidylinositol transfer protein [Uncinocarpus reesii 1704]EEP77599.1 phosphatidylglycerol/phosphatidylinositol transfer protein [Uncinocarpus reesii 1704]